MLTHALQKLTQCVNALKMQHFNSSSIKYFVLFYICLGKQVLMCFLGSQKAPLCHTDLYHFSSSTGYWWKLNKFISEDQIHHFLLISAISLLNVLATTTAFFGMTGRRNVDRLIDKGCNLINLIYRDYFEVIGLDLVSLHFDNAL